MMMLLAKYGIFGVKGTLQRKDCLGVLYVTCGNNFFFSFPGMCHAVAHRFVKVGGSRYCVTVCERAGHGKSPFPCETEVKVAVKQASCHGWEGLFCG